MIFKFPAHRGSYGSDEETQLQPGKKHLDPIMLHFSGSPRIRGISQPSSHSAVTAPGGLWLPGISGKPIYLFKNIIPFFFWLNTGCNPNLGAFPDTFISAFPGCK